MLTGLERDADARHLADLAPPHARAVDHVLRLYRTLVRIDAGNAAPVLADAGDLDVLEDQRPAVARALGQRQRDVAGVGLPIRGQEDAAFHALQVHERVLVAASLGREHFGLKPEGMGHGRPPGQLLHPVVAECQGEGAALAEPGRDAGLRLERAVEVGGVLGELGHV